MSKKIVALALLAALSAPGIVLAAPGDDEDRYGPPQAPFVDPAATEPAQRTLSWPGKAAATPAQPMSAPIASAAPAAPYAPQAYPQTPAVTAVTAPSLPASLYAPPPSPLMAPAAQPVPAPSASAQTASAQAAAGQPPRFYSLHREFGLTPDPAPVPLPTQFFAPSADLAEPPPPPPPHVLPAGQQAMTASARARADAGDPDAAPATLDNSTP